jgi:hypothetical protein
LTEVAKGKDGEDESREMARSSEQSTNELYFEISSYLQFLNEIRWNFGWPCFNLTAKVMSRSVVIL